MSTQLESDSQEQTFGSCLVGHFIYCFIFHKQYLGVDMSAFNVYMLIKLIFCYILKRREEQHNKHVLFKKSYLAYVYIKTYTTSNLIVNSAQKNLCKKKIYKCTQICKKPMPSLLTFVKKKVFLLVFTNHGSGRSGWVDGKRRTEPRGSNHGLGRFDFVVFATLTPSNLAKFIYIFDRRVAS